MDAEESVIGAMLLSPSAIDACSFLSPSDFYGGSLGLIFETIVAMHAEGEPVDAVTVAARVQNADHSLGHINIAVRIHELAALVPATSNARHYAKIVRKMAQRRKVLKRLWEVTEAVEGGDLNAIEALNVDDILYEVDEGGVSFFEAIQDFEEEIKNPPDLTGGVATPFTFLSRWQPGRLYIVAGYAKDGKTVFAEQAAVAAARSGRKTGFISLEMSWRDLRDRMIAACGHVPFDQVQARRIAPDYDFAYKSMMREFATMPIDIFDDTELTVDAIRRIQRERKYDFLIIDHLHRFDWKERRDIERIVRGITNLAKQASIPILLLAQLKRPYNTDKAPRPTLSMLRESGMIEAEASMVAFVYRHRNEYGNRTAITEFNVVANRYGGESVTTMDFNEEYVRLDEYPDDWRETVAA